MSCWQNEHGKFRLPTAEFAGVRQQVASFDKAVKTEAFTEAQRFWKSLPTKARSDPHTYDAAVREFCYGGRGLNGGSSYNRRGVTQRTALADETFEMLHKPLRQGGRPRRVKKDDVDWPTNRTTTFRIGDDAYINFDRANSTVTWTVYDNNYSRDRAHEHPATGAFFKALERVRWTRGTGGSMWGNDEYHQDAYSGMDGGGNYSTYAIGPLGESEAPIQCVEYLDSKGQLRRRTAIIADATKAQRRSRANSSAGSQGRVQRGVTAGGEFTARRRGEPGTRL